MQIQITPNIARIPDDIKVHVVHAGKLKSRFEAVVKHEKIILDMPGVRLSKSVINDDQKLSRHILMSNAIKTWKKEGGTKDKKILPPARQANKYEIPKDSSKIKSISYSKTAIQRFFAIKKNDLVVVPTPRPYEPFLVGRIIDDPDPRKILTLDEYPSDPFPARSVEWIKNSTLKRNLSEKLSQKLEYTHVVNEIDLAKHSNEIFGNIFGTYTYKDGGGVSIYCPRYRGKNPLETISTQKTIAFIVALHQLSTGSDSEFDGDRQQLSYEQIIHNFYDEALVSDLQQEFHSPGFYRLKLTSSELVIALSVCIPLLTAGCFDEVSFTNASVVNSADTNSQLSDEELRDIIKPMIKHMSMSPKVQEKAKIEASDASDSVGMKTLSNVGK